MKVILASKSPRRKEILQNLNIDFDVVPSYCDEICGKTKPEDIVCELAERKAKSIDSQDIVIGSDTIVVYDGQVFGKPKDRDDAYQMLKSLQDSWHTVYTGVCIMKNKMHYTYCERTEVHIKALSDKEIHDYIETGEPMDKAGAYAIQGKAGKFVDKYVGEYETIVGLPIKKLKYILQSDIMDIYNINDIKLKLKSNLSKKRFQHCLRVSYNAQRLAEHFSYNDISAQLAGFLHDCAKELSSEEMISVCREHNIPLGDKDIKEAHYLHGVVGACIAKEQYNIKNKEILLAIANHSGRPDMTPLEKIIMLSDLYDGFFKRKIDISYIKNVDGLDDAFLKMLRPVLQFCVDKNIYMAERTQDTFDYILAEKLKEKFANKDFIFDVKIMANNGTDSITYSNTELEDEMFEKAINVYKEHGIKLKSVKNIRDLGGYTTQSGQYIKKHKILRSAELTKLSKEDARYLKDYGITTIIDFRSLEEVQQNPDINIDDFEYHNCPLVLSDPQLNSFRNRMIERKDQAFSKNEDIWYNVQYFASFNMLDMYKDILTDKESLKQVKKIFSILSQADGGVLIHCTSGKDRVGIITILLLYYLGCKYSDIRVDYFTSSIYGLASTESYIVDLYLDGYGRKIIDETRRVMGISVDLLPSLKSIIENKYKTVENYIQQEVNIDKQDLQNIKNKFLAAKS